MRQRDPRQWERFVRVYGMLVYEWCRRAGISQEDAADVTQDVFCSVAEKLDSFRREQEGDTFQGWLWVITRNKVLDHFRRRGKCFLAEGGSSAQHRLNGLPEVLPAREVEADVRSLRHRALELLRTDFEEKTWRAFWLTAIEHVEPTAVAEKLGMKLGSVYNARYKVTRRLREEFEDLV